MSEPRSISRRRGTEQEHEGFTGANAEITVDTTNNRLVVHDGETQGGHPQATKKYVDDKASLLSSEIEAAKKGIKPFGTKAEMDAFTPGDGDPPDNREIAQVMNDSTVGNNGEYRWDGSVWVKRDSLAEVKDVKGWVSNILDGYGVDINSLVYSDNGNIESGDFTWPDGEVGSFSNLDEDNGDLVSFRLNRPSNKYITVFANGNLTATGY